jgi:hypothetical protein
MITLQAIMNKSLLSVIDNIFLMRCDAISCIKKSANLETVSYQ